MGQTVTNYIGRIVRAASLTVQPVNATSPHLPLVSRAVSLSRRIFQKEIPSTFSSTVAAWKKNPKLSALPVVATFL